MSHLKHFETFATDAGASVGRVQAGGLWAPLADFFDEDLDLKFSSNNPSDPYHLSASYALRNWKNSLSSSFAFPFPVLAVSFEMGETHSQFSRQSS